MLNQLTTLDHEIMGVLLKSTRALTLYDIGRCSKSRTQDALKSVEKLMEQGFVRRVQCGASSLYVAVLDCPYFPPVAAVAARDFLAFDDAELTRLVDALDPVLTGPSAH
ncbi:hypothetical protein MSP8886_01406 [Marinomonas spartinae]|uniref:Uncharacterized protein n=1 Tax=Marinomonas spartinae TaxID=1792290 RepID=A0A1A8TBN7_9GAMM|nr:MarR family transcriptional regulator [Marinomonas spartinae]SBS29026.1 hypothetical protein MSP8886_01406 [Marinomonas spartinae]